MSSNYILTWGRPTTISFKDIENALIERTIITKQVLTEMKLKLGLIGYKNKLFQLANAYDRITYLDNPTEHDVSSIYFVFDPYSDLEPMAQYNYGSIYEYAGYLEEAMVSLKYETSDEIIKLRVEYISEDICKYAKILENRAWQHDTNTMDVFEECDWFNPLRRYTQLELGDSIDLLETHLLKTYTHRQLKKLHTKCASDASYLLSLSQMTFHLQNKKK
jgi:hypothetical protein